MMRSSGLAARKLSLFLIAFETISGKKRDTELSSGYSLRSSRLPIGADGSLAWETAEVNYYAKAVVFSRCG